jgi:3-oxoacyl-[acyl-carrier protein] reductase
MQFDFKDQTAIVSGGTRGIGRAISEAFLQAGAKVLATYNSNRDSAEKFLQDNKEHSERLSIHGFDVSKPEEVERFYKETPDAGNFQILVHSAGIRADAIVGLMKAEEWNRVIETNLGGTFNMCKFAVQNLTRKRYGRLIVITSPIGRFGMAGQANYAASKAGQVAFTRSLAMEVAKRKITVNCVSPGFIDTDFISDLPDEQRQAYLDMIPLKRFGTAEEVAHSVLFLASREAGYITGSVQEITGGL